MKYWCKPVDVNDINKLMSRFQMVSRAIVVKHGSFRFMNAAGHFCCVWSVSNVNQRYSLPVK